jgi:hypothetical protein
MRLGQPLEILLSQGVRCSVQVCPRASLCHLPPPYEFPRRRVPSEERALIITDNSTLSAPLYWRPQRVRFLSTATAGYEPDPPTSLSSSPRASFSNPSSTVSLWRILPIPPAPTVFEKHADLGITITRECLELFDGGGVDVKEIKLHIHSFLSRLPQATSTPHRQAHYSAPGVLSGTDVSCGPSISHGRSFL